MDAAIAALLGASVGAIGGIAGTWIQQRQQTHRERLKMAVDLGIHDHKTMQEVAFHEERPAMIAPVSAFVVYHSQIIERLAAGASTEQMVELSRKLHKTLDAFGDCDRNSA